MYSLQGRGMVQKSIVFEVKVATSFLKKLGIREPILFDVGAHLGEYSIEFLKHFPSSKVMAFEPNTQSFKMLEKRMHSVNNVSLQPIGLGRSNKIQNLYFNCDASPLSSLTRRRLDHFRLYLDKSEEVTIRTLDSFVSEFNIQPDFIKVDVEGHELEVLEGAVKTLEKSHLVQFEFGGTMIDTRTYFQDFWYLLTNKGFDIFRISKSRPIAIKSYQETEEVFLKSEYLAVRRN
jgi:FkbM family methyltransferase